MVRSAPCPSRGSCPFRRRLPSSGLCWGLSPAPALTARSRGPPPAFPGRTSVCRHGASAARWLVTTHTALSQHVCNPVTAAPAPPLPTLPQPPVCSLHCPTPRRDGPTAGRTPCPRIPAAAAPLQHPSWSSSPSPLPEPHAGSPALRGVGVPSPPGHGAPRDSKRPPGPSPRPAPPHNSLAARLRHKVPLQTWPRPEVPQGPLFPGTCWEVTRPRMLEPAVPLRSTEVPQSPGTRGLGHRVPMMRRGAQDMHTDCQPRPRGSLRPGPGQDRRLRPPVQRGWGSHRPPALLP